MAYKVLDEIPTSHNPTTLEQDLVLLGLVGMIDPPRPEVGDAMAHGARAGIRTVMITGDYRDTAVAIAGELGIMRPGGRALSGAEIDELDDDAPGGRGRARGRVRSRVARAQGATSWRP